MSASEVNELDRQVAELLGMEAFSIYHHSDVAQAWWMKCETPIILVRDYRPSYDANQADAAVKGVVRGGQGSPGSIRRGSYSHDPSGG